MHYLDRWFVKTRLFVFFFDFTNQISISLRASTVQQVTQVGVCPVTGLHKDTVYVRSFSLIGPDSNLVWLGSPLHAYVPRDGTFYVGVAVSSTPKTINVPNFNSYKCYPDDPVVYVRVSSLIDRIRIFTVATNKLL